MAEKLTTRQHIENLEAMREQGAERDDILQYMAEKKVSKAEADKIIDFINQPTGANVARQALGQGALLGFGDELEGVARGLLGDRTISEEIDRARQRVKMYEANYPERAIPATLAGGLATGGVGTARAAMLKGAPLLARIAQGAKTGAGYGAVGGAGTAEGGVADRAVGAGYGTLTGGVTGGAFPVIAAGGRALLDSIKGIAPGAARRIAERNVREAADYDEVTPGIVSQVFREGPDVMAGADVADPRAMALRNAARLAANVRGGVQGLRFVGERADAQGRRIQKAMEGGLPTTSLDDFLEQSLKVRRASALKNYGDAYAQELKQTDELKSLLKNEIIQEAYAGAKRLAKYEGINLDDAVEELASGTKYVKPTLQVMDYIKQNLDDKVNELYRAGKGGEGSRAAALRDRLRNHLDDQIPAYKDARSVYAGHSAAMEAAELGEKFILNPRKISPNLFKKMGDHEKESFRVGVAEALRMKINTSPDGSNIVRKIFGNPDARARLQLAFGNDEAFEAFRKAMEAEARMAATGSRVLNVSSTAPMLADQASLGQLAVQAGEAVSNPMTALARAGMAMQGGPASDDIAAETRKLLLDPANKARLLQVLAASNPALQRRLGRITPTVGNVLAGQSPQVNPLLPY